MARRRSPNGANGIGRVGNNVTGTLAVIPVASPAQQLPPSATVRETPVAQRGRLASSDREPSATADTPFSRVTIDQVRRFLTDATPKWLKETRAFVVEGDHWQSGNQWIGPQADDSAPEGAADAQAEIEDQFVSKNVLAQLCARHRDGVCGEEPIWGLTVRRALDDDEEPTQAEQALIDEAEAALTAWWDEREGHELFQRWVYQLLWASRATLRLYVPQGLLIDAEYPIKDANGAVTGTATRRVIRVEPSTDANAEAGGTPGAAQLSGALQLLYPDDPEPDEATVFVDPDSQRKLGIVSYKRLVNFIETGAPNYELTYLDADDQTIIRIVQSTSAGTIEAAATEGGDTADPLDLGGRIPMFEGTRPRFITEQLVEQQRALNLTISMLPRNVVTGGFAEMMLFNAMMPGTDSIDATTGETIFTPGTFRRGPATVNFLRGIEIDDQQTGKRQLTTPSATFRQPVDPKPTIEAARAIYQDMLEEADQAHVLMSGDATASGKSRETALKEYARSLRPTVTRANRAGRWLLETLLAMAEAFIGQPGKYTNQLRAQFECRVDLGAVDPAQQTANIQNAERGFLSRETAMQLNGVQDVDSEVARINTEPDAALDLLTRRANAMAALRVSIPDIDVETAATLAGFEGEELTMLVAAEKKAQEAAAQAAADAQARMSASGAGGAGAGAAGGAGGTHTEPGAEPVGVPQRAPTGVRVPAGEL